MNEISFIHDRKRDYLIKTLSRTKRKDYENYVVNAIYHKLNRLDIKPVTQQYIKRSDGRYALVDLYFPQLNYAVECDEKYHIENSKNDKLRELTMEEMLDSVEETKGFILRRIKAYESIESIQSQIHEVVKEIELLIEEKSVLPWDINLDPAGYAIEKGIITIEDRLEFRVIPEVARCFGKNYKRYFKSGINLGDGYTVWCPKLAPVVEGEAKPVTNGWVNTLSDDWNYVYEKNHLKDDVEYAKGNIEEQRIIFAKSKNNFGQDYYRFIGVYKFDESTSSNWKNAYKRVATEISLGLWMK